MLTREYGVRYEVLVHGTLWMMNDAALGQKLKDDADPLPQRVSRAKWVIAKVKGVRRDSELKRIRRNDPHYFSPVLL